jgi:hypothetical protein
MYRDRASERRQGVSLDYADVLEVQHLKIYNRYRVSMLVLTRFAADERADGGADQVRTLTPKNLTTFRHKIKLPQIFGR